jgi:hypothetical protein
MQLVGSGTACHKGAGVPALSNALSPERNAAGSFDIAIVAGRQRAQDPSASSLSAAIILLKLLI